MLENFKKAIFRVLCLGCALLGGGGIRAEPNPEERDHLGIKRYEKQDFTTARKSFEKACDLKNGGGGLMAEPNPEELVLLGIKSYEKQDFSKARKYFEKACDLNNGGGCSNLGVLYQNGQGVEKDLIKAAYLYSRACELKEGDGCGALGGVIL
ncbi:tetratricopeptide repeat protein [Helicobacter pylori]|uniref:tetratricopeptide repeat protein n=1 Tax=Helicobacter pylori TaxID=210 RepID=UPI003F93B417